MGVDQMIKLPRKIYRCDKCLRLEEFDVGRDGSTHRFAWPESKLCDGTLDLVELTPAQATVWKLAGFEALVELLIYESTKSATFSGTKRSKPTVGTRRRG